MRNKLSVVLFTVFLFGLFVSASMLYAADNLHPKTTYNPERSPRFMIPYEKPSTVPHQTESPIPLNLKFQPPTNSPGQRAGLTTYDYQHNGSMGRQVAINQSAGYVFIVWMAQDNYVIPGNRSIFVQAFNTLSGSYELDAGGYNATNPDYCGYTSCDWAPTGEAAFGCHVDPGSGTYSSTYYHDGLFPTFVFYSDAMVALPDSSWYQPEMIWPIIGTHDGDSTNVTEDVIYVLTHVFEGSEDMILFRGVGTPPTWDNGQYIETVTDLSYTIVPDANSDKVAIVYTDDRNGLAEGAGNQDDLDVYYKLSTDQGASWGSPVCVSNYSEENDSLWRAYSDVSAVITPDGFIHIIAPVRELRSQSSYENYKSRLVHWDVDLATEAVSKASVIDEARYVMQLAPNRPCDPDAWNLYIAKPSVSYCEGKLYALYTKFGDDNEPNALNDCSQAAFANGELYLAGSDTYLGAALGRTWDTAWNITKTRTPLCDSAQCESDHWSSMARYGYAYGDGTVPDTLDIMYINDKDAGGIPQGSGTWTENNVMHYRFPCRPVAHIPKISLEPTQFLDPIHTAPDSELTVSLKINNIGNEVMNIASVTAVDLGFGTNWINISSFTTPVDPNDFTTVTITLNYNTVLSSGNDPAGYDAQIMIDHDAPSNVDYVPIHLTVASDFNMPEEGALNTTCKALEVFNTARLGGDTQFFSLDIPGDCDSVDASPNSAIYLYDGSPMITWNDGTENLAYTTVFTQDFTEPGTFRPQSDLNLYTEADYDMAVCTVTTTDSLYGIAINLYAPTDGVNCFIIGEYTFFNWNPIKGATDVYLGFMTDWDIPSDNSVDNGSGTSTGVDGLYKTMWQYGADYGPDNETACPTQIVETDRLGGVAVFKGPDPGEAPLLNAWAAENAPNQLGSGFDKEYLYTQMSTLSGYHPFTGDSLIDLHTGMTFAKVDMTAKASYRYVIGLITTNQGEADYLDQVVQARAWAVAQGIIVDFVCDCTPGDANHDSQVNVGDAVYMINYVFKQGPAPSPYAICNGDANNDAQANVGDAVYIINYVFKQGPPPPSCEDWVAAHGQPLFK